MNSGLIVESPVLGTSHYLI